MLLDEMIINLKSEMPELNFTVNKDKHTIIIPPKHEGFGSIEILDDVKEFTVFIGDFTHWHCECYDQDLTAQEQAESAASEVTEFLLDLFQDKIIVWGDSNGGGGFYRQDERRGAKKYRGKLRKEWLWSGPVSS